MRFLVEKLEEDARLVRIADRAKHMSTKSGK